MQTKNIMQIHYSLAHKIVFCSVFCAVSVGWFCLSFATAESYSDTAFANASAANTENASVADKAEADTADKPAVLTVNVEHIVELPRLSSFDNIFVQYSNEVEQNYKLNASKKKVDLMFYKYRTQKNETLFTISARLSIPYETLATLNGISGAGVLLENTVLVIPNAAGIFVCENPKSSLEILIANSDIAIAQNKKIWYNIEQTGSGEKSVRKFFFVQNARFSPTERAYFLDTTLRIPLDSYWLSSAYGMRVSPISGKWRFHNGIDMAAPEGASVYACKTGKVMTAKTGDATFGDYVVLQHEGGMTSLYAHLSRILVSEGVSVHGGQQIGKVGHTGLATGPHLHFEVRLNGAATDPQKMLSR